MWKFIQPVVIVALVVVLVESCMHHKQQLTQVLDNLRISRDSVKTYRDQNGELVAQRETMLVKASELEGQAVSLGLDKERLEQQVGRLSNLVSYYRGELQSRGQVVSRGKDTVVVEVVKGDTIKHQVKEFDYANAFLFLHQLYWPDSNKLVTDYTYTTGIELTVYRKREHKLNVFERKRTYADLRLTDPNAKLLSATSVLVEEEEQWYEFYKRWWFIAGVSFIFGVWVAK